MGTERKRAFIIQFIYYVILAGIVVVVMKWGIPMLSPFVLAFIVAYLLRWPTKFISRKLKLPYKPVALFLALLCYSTVGMLIGLMAIRAFYGIRGLVAYLPQLYSTYMEPALREVQSGLEPLLIGMDESLFALVQQVGARLITWLGSYISQLSAKAVGAASGAAAAIPGLFIQLVLMIISTCFIAADYEELRAGFLRMVGRKAAEIFLQVKAYLMGTLLVCIASYAIIATLTFVELSIGLKILKIEYSMLIAFAIAIFDILPVLGTGGIMIPWAILTLLRGNVSRGLGLLLIYVVITVIRNIVEPKFVGGKLGLHPVITLASMFAGAQIFGVVGLFGFPIGLSLLLYLNDNGTIRLFRNEEYSD